MNYDIKILKKLLRKQIKLIIFLLLLIIILLLAGLYIITPHIILKGDKKIEIEVNSEYKELGVIAKVGLKQYKNIEIANNVDTNKIGEYVVKYRMTYKNKHYIKERIVLVKDSTAPIIKLNGKTKTNICSNSEYIDEGAIAIDNYDGDLSKNIKVKKEKDKVIYSVKDKSGNETKVIRKLIVKDKSAPVINLNSDTYVYSYLGEEYIDAIPTVIDNCDGDLSNKIVISGLDEIDINNIGEYSINYEVSDSNNNISKVTKIVKIVERPLNEKVIYLTFDDGPSATVTSQILDILKEEDVKATFFVINHSDDLNYLIKREYDEGHTVALHSYTHNYGQIYASVDAYFEDLEAIRNKVKGIIGEETKIIRFPGGSSNTVSSFNPGIMTTLASEVGNRGYIYFDWNVSSGDAGGSYTASDVYNSVVNELNAKSNIVLLHDFESNYKTLNALRDIIIYAKKNGYVFDKITESTPKIRHGINN